MGALRRCRRWLPSPLLLRVSRRCWPPLLLLLLLLGSGASTERLLAAPGSEWPSALSEGVPAGSVVQCALLCLRRPAGCAGAEFRRAAGLCQLQLPADELQQLRPAAAAGDVALQRAASCRQLQRLGHTADGVYRGRGLPAPLYCDMTRTLGGGWTLLVAATAMTGWNLDNVLERNTENPSITDNYSILRYGDRIKTVGTSDRFRYRLEAQLAAAPGRERWGGVWQADRSHTLAGTSSNQTSVRQLTFDVWPAGPRTPRDVVPWINRGAHPKLEPLLTASLEDDRYWWGSIIAEDDGANTAWIAGTEAERPDTVLYWVREE